MVGILSSAAMLRAWRAALAIIIVVAAVVTPSQDPISLFATAIPMWVFYFAAAGWPGLSSSQPAPGAAPSWSTPQAPTAATQHP